MQQLRLNFFIVALSSMNLVEFADSCFRAGVKEPEEDMKTVEEVIAYHGYPVESHTIHSQDGYLLKMQRIPYGKEGPPEPGSDARQPLILYHGLFGSAACWVFNTPDKNLAYRLVNEGYDVWLGNMRGTEGTDHIRLTTTDDEFWNFSWDEMAKYDLPATIDYILRKTGFPSVKYVGYSLGSAIIFALLSTRVEYNTKVKGIVALAPAATLQHVKTPVKLLALPIVHPLAFKIFGFLEHGNFHLNHPVIDAIKKRICAYRLLSGAICAGSTFFVFGPDQQLNMTRLNVFLNFVPHQTSVRNFQHVVQLMQSSKFQQFDFGLWNMRKYGQRTPPEYNLTAVTTPVILYSSVDDWWAQPGDVQRLAAKLPNLLGNNVINDDRFSHLDFLWAKDVNRLLYDNVLTSLKLFT